MPIKVMCPTCSQEGSVRDDFKGDAITCPSCRMRFDVKQWTVPALSERRTRPAALDTPEAILRFRIQQAIGGAVFGAFFGLLASREATGEASGGSSILTTLGYTLAGAAFVGIIMFVNPHPRGGRSSGGDSGGWGGDGDGGGGDGGGGDGGGGGGGE
ncbi:hypothetical protein [Tautonia marina]|uniref:hypothetical protein n=1 Tax=Tautonia marina TaxID=2653855 RepID=UPI00191C1551|nr:hypothetical protein [Tautonia marina]